MPLDVWLSLLMVGFVAYLIGSIPFGLILARAAGLGDIRTIGSGNIGATNVLRTGNKKIALLTLILDFAKGLLSIMFLPHLVDAIIGAMAIEISDGILYAIPAGQDLARFTLLVLPIAVVLGHMFPIWLNFRGGKGVATMFGIYFAIAWALGLTAAIIWLGVFFLTRYSSFAALTALPFAPLIVQYMLPEAAPYTVFQIVAAPALLVIYKHLPNIQRLIAGNELQFIFDSKTGDR